MPTFITHELVYGPVMSRRLGASLGVNLSPLDGKVCTFDCLYCENGLNAQRRSHTAHPTAAALEEALRAKLEQMRADGMPLDVITLAGNGEPTANPEFPQVAEAALALRDELAPSARVAVLTNATLLGRPAVFDALMRVDDPICKLDTVDAPYIELLDRPNPGYSVEQVIERLAAMDGHAIVQTMFLRGSWEGHDLDNTTETYVAPWLAALQRIAPKAVTIYTIARDTPVSTLEKADRATLDAICTRVQELGIPCSASY